jgi:hypothetical protein
MINIYEMATGTEYLGEEFRCAKATPSMTDRTAQLAHSAHQVEPRLAAVENRSGITASSDFPAGLDINHLINAIED